MNDTTQPRRWHDDGPIHGRLAVILPVVLVAVGIALIVLGKRWTGDRLFGTAFAAIGIAGFHRKATGIDRARRVVVQEIRLLGRWTIRRRLYPLGEFDAVMARLDRNEDSTSYRVGLRRAAGGTLWVARLFTTAAADELEQALWEETGLPYARSLR